MTPRELAQYTENITADFPLPLTYPPLVTRSGFEERLERLQSAFQQLQDRQRNL